MIKALSSRPWLRLHRKDARGRIGLAGLFMLCLPLVQPAAAQAPETPLVFAQAQPGRAPQGGALAGKGSEVENDLRLRTNNWSVSILGGYMTGVLIRMAVDLQTAFEDGDELRILPIVSHGAKQNVLDLLYLKGADIAITHADVFEELKKEGQIKNIDKRVQYISQLHISGVHVLVRPEIKTLKDLEGKKVGFHGVGSGVDATASILFPRLGVKPVKVNVPNSVGLEKLKNGEISGLVHLLTRSDVFLTKIPAELGLHLLNIEYDDKFADYYTPYTIEQAEYPNLIPPGQKVETLGLPAVLAVYNWPRETDRYRRVERFIQYYFTNFDKLKQPPYQPDWKGVNLGAKVPGWTRYPVAEEALAKLARHELITGTNPPAGVETASELMDPRQRQLFNEFLEWKKQQGKR
ncbi:MULTISPECIES: TAXI family TRAP transporter solute-binding subunit [Rhodomicrobium]|uniref:TAXI family TRAP transporter solute-binding subunit n=1 Tax=Rhodomicrobium TaxID=1068 RepID=UPI000B4AA2DE|nr:MULTISPECIES: TAXI family TRAP transporter solute-binding subunit [Rhodomicrobium]